MTATEQRSEKASEAKLKELLDGLINCVESMEMSTDAETDSKEVWKCRDEILSMFRELEAERDDYKKYARHAPDCNLNDVEIYTPVCTCGLDAAKAGQ